MRPPHHPEEIREACEFARLFTKEIGDYMMGDTPRIAQEDAALTDWLLNASSFAGDFLKTISEAALRADQTNYPFLRPYLLFLKAKFPHYAQRYTGIRPKENNDPQRTG